MFDFEGDSTPWMSWMSPAATTDGFEVTLPGTPDVNHVDGIGVIYLVAHLPLEEIRALNNLRYGPLDLNETSLTVRLRGQNVDLKGGRLAWWIVSDLPAHDTRFPWQQTNWAHTATTLPVIGPQWQDFSVVINSNEAQWTYAGNNRSVQGAWGERYAYGSPIEALGRVDRTLHLVVLGGPGGDAPTGRIEIDWISLRPATIAELGISRDTANAEAPPPDFATAILPQIQAGRWQEIRPDLELLAAQGDPEALLYLSRALKYGLGGPPDLRRSMQAYLKAAPHSAEPSLELGEMLALGSGSERDPLAALGHLTQFSLDQSPRALRHRGLICQQWQLPSGCDSVGLLGMAASLGDELATDILSNANSFDFESLYGSSHLAIPSVWPHDYENEVVPLLATQRWADALPMLRALADVGHAGAALHAANALKYGLGGERDFAAARRYYVRAATCEAEAEVELAEIYLNGEGGPRDMDAALAHLLRADPAATARAKRILGQICLHWHSPLRCDAQMLLTDGVTGRDAYAAVTLAMDALQRRDESEAKRWFDAANELVPEDDTTLGTLLRYHDVR